MGLPGSGKTTLASELVPLLNAKWLNADEVRNEANDWDFSAEGRTRQAKRMWAKAKEFRDQGNHVVADFVCPTLLQEHCFQQILLYGSILLKKVGLMILIKCS